jgi:hypothetical protein
MVRHLRDSFERAAVRQVIGDAKKTSAMVKMQQIQWLIVFSRWRKRESETQRSPLSKDFSSRNLWADIKNRLSCLTLARNRPWVENQKDDRFGESPMSGLAKSVVAILK